MGKYLYCGLMRNKNGKRFNIICISLWLRPYYLDPLSSNQGSSTGNGVLANQYSVWKTLHSEAQEEREVEMQV